MQPERVDPPPKEQRPTPPRQRFEEVLRARTDRPVRRTPPPPRRTATAASPHPPGLPLGGPVQTPGERRGQARLEMDASARQRVADGAVATSQATGRLAGRTAELLRAALGREDAARWEASSAPAPGERAHPGQGAEPVSPRAESAASGVGPSGETTAPAPVDGGRVERALALVERIERFVRSGRPSLALTLRGGLPGRLELQRVSPGAISIRLSSTRPPSPAELSVLRQALEARGLSVRSLETRTLRASSADACSPCP